MLRVLERSTSKRNAQRMLEQNLRSTLKYQGSRSIGFPGGSFERPVLSNGAGELWASVGGTTDDGTLPRYWNGFGIYHPDKGQQSIVVEINIALGTDSEKIAGFFADDPNTGETYLMHSGRVGGGRPGIGRSQFLVWSSAKPTEAIRSDGSVRTAFVVGKLSESDLADRILRYVNSVQQFKQAAVAGMLDNSAFKAQVREFQRYQKEYAGRKLGLRSGTLEYITYHGDIVDKLWEERETRKLPGEKVYNTGLIDLCVTRNGRLSEIYEIKTGTGRQLLYTAIGQVLTHAPLGRETAVVRYIVVPADEPISPDIEHAMSSLGIRLRRFRIQGSRRRQVELV